jgi:predicted O-linked N-acetylglucosamine transferase (SPINDLY family)
MTAVAPFRVVGVGQDGPATRGEKTVSGSAVTLSQAMGNAVAAFKAGRLAEAEQLCNAIVAAKQEFVEAFHLLAVVQSSLGRLDDALASYDRALALRPDYVEALCDRGVTLHRAGRFDIALASYDRALALRPDHAVAHYNRGITLFELRRFDAALASYDRALTLCPEYPPALANRANALREMKRLDEALASCDRALALQPDFADALHNRGVILYELNRLDEALASYDRALAVRPAHAETLCNRGNTLKAGKRFAEALASCDRALVLRPDFAEALYGRADILKEDKRLDEALASYDRALALRPADADALSNQGVILHQLHRFEEALLSYDKAVAIRPDFADAHYNRGLSLFAMKRPDDALACFDQALRLRPGHAETLNNRGIALYELDRFEEALSSYDEALAIRPDFVEAYCNRGATLRELGYFAESRASYAKAIALKPDHTVARFGQCMAELPVLYADEREIITQRAAYERRLMALCNTAVSGTDLTDLASGVGSNQPFLLAYQGYNDRDLQAFYGSFVCRIMAERYPPVVPSSPTPPAASEPVRVGIVSGFFRQHSNWKLPIKGWLRQLDRRQFRIFGYHTGFHQDTETKAAAALCDRFVQGPLPVDRWRAEILADAPHVLIYPEIGMDAAAAALAAQRLAAVQCNSWGHPDTSGFPTLDYYLGSDLMEPPDGQDHYTERLVRLPNLSVYCEPVEAPTVAFTRHDLGLRASAALYWCGQSLFKYLPQFDYVFPRIARAAGDCQFVFIQYQKSQRITELFRRRLDRAFAAFGLRAEQHCVILPRLDGQAFVAATGLCDIFLDSIGWSGCNSTLESLCHDLPIVTMAGPLMRGRHGMAILNRMGVTDTIVETIEDYIASAVRLARDVPWRSAVKAKIAAGKHRIYYDSACISELEQFLDRVGRRTAAE